MRKPGSLPAFLRAEFGPMRPDLYAFRPEISGVKKPRKRGFCSMPKSIRLGGLNVGSLLAFRALRDFERYFLTFFEGLEAIHVDCGKVGKQIFTAVIWSDKAETFGIVKPLDCTCCHKSVSQIKTNHTSHKSKKQRNPASSSTCPFVSTSTPHEESCVLINEHHCSRNNYQSQAILLA